MIYLPPTRNVISIFYHDNGNAIYFYKILSFLSFALNFCMLRYIHIYISRLEITVPNFCFWWLAGDPQKIVLRYHYAKIKFCHIYTIYHIIKSIVNKLMYITLVTKLWLSAIPSNDFKDGIMMMFYSWKKPCTII